jgi:hypothetical protein
VATREKEMWGFRRFTRTSWASAYAPPYVFEVASHPLDPRAEGGVLLPGGCLRRQLRRHAGRLAADEVPGRGRGRHRRLRADLSAPPRGRSRALGAKGACFTIIVNRVCITVVYGYVAARRPVPTMPFGAGSGIRGPPPSLGRQFRPGPPVAIISAHGVSHCKSVLCGAFVWVRRARTSPRRRVSGPAGQYWKVVTRDATAAAGAAPRCADNVRKSWAALFAKGETAAGRAALSQTFRTCAALQSAEDVEKLAPHGLFALISSDRAPSSLLFLRLPPERLSQVHLENMEQRQAEAAAKEHRSWSKRGATAHYMKGCREARTRD